jgi:hypothetical protein
MTVGLLRCSLLSLTCHPSLQTLRERSQHMECLQSDEVIIKARHKHP